MKTKLLFIFLLICCYRFYGQIGFQSHPVLSDNPLENNLLFDEVIKADIDNDGDLDIVASTTYSLLWYENTDGNGHFQKTFINLNTNTSSGLAVGDVDGDGDLDIVAGSYGDNYNYLYLNIDGNGNFGFPQPILSIDENIIILTDMDGDGDLDMLFQRARWSENLDGQGTFGPRQNLESSQVVNYNHIFSEDIDGDGDTDVITGHSTTNNYEMAVFRNLGGGTFADKEILINPDFHLWNLVLSDVDGDGDKDFIVKLYNAFNGFSVGWYENLDGLGNYGTFQLIRESTEQIYLGIHADDIDGDGDKDLLVSTTNTDTLLWFENTDGLGNYGADHIIEDVSYANYGLIAADFDGDTDLDLLIKGYSNHGLGLLKNLDGLGNFGFQTIIDLRFAGFSYDVEGADMDGDGDLDITYRRNTEVLWLENMDGQGSFGNHHILGQFSNSTRSFKLCDIDNDGDIDAVVNTQYSSSNPDDSIYWMENVNGDGVYFVHHPISFSNNSMRAIFIYPADMDGDGDLDILALQGNSQLTWFENLDGNGAFGFEAASTPPISSDNIGVGDIDSDGDMDVVVSGNNGVYWSENTDGQGTLNVEELLMVPSAVGLKVFPVDFDSDGDIDIVYQSATKVIWVENLDGEGTFGSEGIIYTNTASTNISSVFIKDIDADGTPDVLITHINSVHIRLNNNQQISYGAFTIDSNLPQARGVFADDIDGDNDIDFVASSSNYSKWYENMGDVGNEISGIIRYDLEDDGCADNAEQNISPFLVIADNGVDTYSTFSQHDGSYSLLIGEGSFNIHPADQQTVNLNTVPNSYTMNFIGLNNNFTADFCLTSENSINDLFVSVYPMFGNLVLSGFDTTYHIVYGNRGNTPMDGSISFKYEPDKMYFVSANQVVSSETPLILNFDFVDLNPLETRSLDLTFNILSSTNVVGGPIETITTIYPIQDDNEPDDNSQTINQIVLSSYDPNDITCLEGDEVLIQDADNYLHYLIRFQNTGNAPAYNIWIENILDNKLDWYSMQLESMSHPGSVEIRNGNEVKFIFDNIQLPDSTSNEPGSHGYIAYKIRPKSNVAVGDIVNNTADIYFDFNAAVTTNTASTEFVETLSINDFGKPKVSVFPNPTTGILNIKGNMLFNGMSLMDINGRALKTEKFIVPVLSHQMRLDDLNVGIYFLTIDTAQGLVNKKVVKR